MDKKVNVTTNFKVLFVFNLIVLLTLIIFRNVFYVLGYYEALIILSFIFNIIFLLVGISFNILFFLRANKYDNNKTLKIIIILFIIYIFFNTVGIYLVNIPFNNGFSKISKELSEYCKSYVCDTYETKNKGNYRYFEIEKTYLDYNNNSNTINIDVKYNYEKVVRISAIIYSDNELFSESLIKKELDGFFNYFNKSVDENALTDAFVNRFHKSIFYGGMNYRITEVYENKELVKLKTKIILKLDK